TSFFRQNEACPCKGKPHFLLPQLPPPHPHNALTFVIELFDIYNHEAGAVVILMALSQRFARAGRRASL
ncbi:MAG: hypothetical protein ACOY3I_10260, partial [Verrucomicrobiota bacterium]